MTDFVVSKGKSFLPFFLRAIVFSTLALSACAPQGARNGNEMSRLQRELADLRSFQAEQTGQISTLTSELRALVGRVEELEYSRNRVQAPSAPVPGPFGSMGAGPVAADQPKIAPPPIVPAKELENDEQLAAGNSSEAGRFFAQGLAQLRRASFSEALALLQEALASSYNTDLYPYLLFWVGVCNDAMGDSRSALRAYHELTSTYAKHNRTALALLREGSVFIRLRDSASAKLTFEKIINDFPGSEEANQAKGRLKDVSR